MNQVDERMRRPVDNAFTFFSDKVERERFSELINSLGDLKWNFLRACRLYGQAVKCKNCNSDVAMTMLCSAIESMQGKESRPYQKFRKFLKQDCPEEFQKSPMKIFVSKKEVRQATFEESISYIYGNFRSLFLHEGIGRVTVELPVGLKNAYFFSDSLADKYREKYYIIERLEILDWFDRVVKESLWCFLNNSKRI
jgi:hypothetical protein